MLTAHKNFLQDLEEQKFTDCTFVFKENDCKKTIVAHKIFLAFASPVFNATFFGPLKETGPIEIPDISFEAFQKMIWIIYGKAATPSSAEEACQLYYAAQKYDLSEPLAVARTYMLSNMSESTAKDFFDATILHDDRKVIAKCCSTIFEKAFNTTKAENFFDSTDPLADEHIFSVAESEDGNALKASIKAYLDKVKTKTNLDMDGLVTKIFELIRILTSEAKKAFEFIIPHTMAKFTCSLNWIPPTGTVEALNATCLREIFPGPGVKCGMKQTISDNIVKCVNGHNISYTCNMFGYVSLCTSAAEMVFAKNGKKDPSAYLLKEIKIMYEEYKTNLQ